MTKDPHFFAAAAVVSPRGMWCNQPFVLVPWHTTEGHATLRLTALFAIHLHSVPRLLFKINGVHCFSPNVRLLASTHALEQLPTPFLMLLCTDFCCCCSFCVILHETIHVHHPTIFTYTLLSEGRLLSWYSIWKSTFRPAIMLCNSSAAM